MNIKINKNNAVWFHSSSILSLIPLILSLSFNLIYFSFNISVDMLCEFCLIKNYADLDINFNTFFLSLAVVIIPMVSLKDPNIMKVVPYLFYKSNDTPPILHSWKKELVCFYDSPKCNMNGI